MRVWTKRGFFVALTIGLVIILISAFEGNTIIYDASKDSKIPDYNEFYSFKEEPRVRDYELVIPKNLNAETVFAVYTAHSEIWIEKDGVPVYSETKGNVLFGKTTGYGWSFVQLNPEDGGKTIKVHCLFAYADQPKTEPAFYFDSIPEIYRNTVQRYALALLVGVVLMLLGISFAVFTLTTNRVVKKIYSKSDFSTLYLGIFSFLLGLWSGNQSQLSALFITSKMLNVSLTYIPLVIMIPVFLLYVREMYSDPKHWIWDIACGAAVIISILTLILQLFNVADFRQLLVATHFMVIVTTILIMLMVIRDIVNKKTTQTMKGHMIPIVICFFCAIADVTSYYNGTVDSNRFGRIGFLILILYSGRASLKNTRMSIIRGRESKLYKLLATKDSLTGLDNRTAFVFETSAAKHGEEKRLGFIMMDLNNLKDCNDTRGHKAGDKYICDAAYLIKRAFEDYGRCYRIGGDEFVVLMKNPSSQTIQDRMEKLLDLQKEYNSDGENYPIGIAWGYAEYNKARDASFEEALSRADAQMYENKKHMKLEKTSECRIIGDNK